MYICKWFIFVMLICKEFIWKCSFGIWIFEHECKLTSYWVLVSCAICSIGKASLSSVIVFACRRRFGMHYDRLIEVPRLPTTVNVDWWRRRRHPHITVGGATCRSIGYRINLLPHNTTPTVCVGTFLVAIKRRRNHFAVWFKVRRWGYVWMFISFIKPPPVV